MSAPPRVAAWLRAAPDGPAPLVHRGRDAVYVDVVGRCVGVVTARATAVPCALRSGLDHLGGVTRAQVADGVLHLDGVPLVVGRLVDVTVPRLRAAAGTHGRPGRSARPRTTVPSVGIAMVGRGEGLTPYDDDVLCGWLAGHRAAGVATPEADAAVRADLGRTTLLSATLLDCALHDEVIPEFGALVAALGTADERAATAALVAVGHTSGAGMLHGVRLALRDVAPDLVREAA